MFQTALIVALVVVGAFTLPGLVLWFLGRKLPATHTAIVTVRIPAQASAIFDLIADAPGHARWSAGVSRVEQVEDRDGHPAYRQYMGRNSFVLVSTTIDPPRTLVRTIADDHAAFSGRWVYTLESIDNPAGGPATRLTLTEEGTIPSAIPRAVMRYLFSYDMYAKRHLISLAKQFPPMITPNALAAKPAAN